jgi:hypothetical protein
VITDARPTSEPVPEVVGTATTGAMDHQGDGLGRIHARTATESDHAVVPPLAVSCDSCGDIVAHRVTLHVAEDFAVQAGVAAGGPGGRHRGQVAESFVGHQQRALHTQFAAGSGEFPDPAGAKADRGGIVPVAVEVHGVGYSDRLFGNAAQPDSRR